MSIQIETPQLLLRTSVEDDFESFAKSHTDPEYKNILA